LLYLREIMVIMVFLFTAVGVLLLGLSIPLVRRRVKPNALYGLRVPATFADEWVWYEANARSGRDLMVLGVVQIALALLLALVPGITEDEYGVTNAALIGVGALLCGVIGWRRANRLLEQRRGEAAGEQP
jgi:uncharacterized membrane protein